MPELTEITNETPAKVEETEARIEDDDDDDSDTTIPELEDTGKWSLWNNTNQSKHDVIIILFVFLLFCVPLQAILPPI